MTDSFGARSALEVGGNQFEIYRLDAVKEGHVDRLPYSLKILLENLLRHEDGRDVTRDDILALANWDPNASPAPKFHLRRHASSCRTSLAYPLSLISPQCATPSSSWADLPKASIHCRRQSWLSTTRCRVDNYGAANALDLNNKIEFQRNKERYSFLRWGQSALENFRVVPPNTGIVHQVNLEYLSRVVFDAEKNGTRRPIRTPLSAPIRTRQ